MAADLTAQWRANDLVAAVETSGVVQQWSDQVGKIVATAQGQPRLVHGAMGGRAAVRFDPADGADSFQVKYTDSPMSGIGDFSVAVVFATSSRTLSGSADAPWFRATGLVDASTLGLSSDWGIAITRDGQIAAGLGFGFTKPPATLYSSVSGLNDGSLHTAVVTRSGSTMTLYLDDRPPDTKADGNSVPLGNLDIAFGILASNENPFSGDIAEIRFYRGALNPTEVQQLRDELTRFYDNRPPVATADTYRTREDEILFFVPSTIGVLQNDRDEEGEPLSVVLVESTSHGSLTLNADGSFVYDSDTDFFGIDTFTYSAVDFRPSEPATVTIYVDPVYDPAAPQPDAYKVLPREKLSVAADQGVLANDLNPDQAQLTAVLADGPSSGTLLLRADGSFEFDAGGFAGTVSFRYQVNDGTTLSTPTSVTIVSNTPPAATDDQYELDEDTLLAVPASDGVIRNDEDADNNQLSTTLVEAPARGTLALRADGSFLYDPDDDFFGTDLFTYRLSDGLDQSSTVTVRLTVRPVNDLPVAADDNYFVLPNQTLLVPRDQGLLANDSDVDDLQLTAVLVDGPAKGRLNLSPDGSFQYTPAGWFEGLDEFTYRARDSQDDSTLARVTLTVTSQPVVISELMAGGSSALSTRTRSAPDGRFSGTSQTLDWIELHNLVGRPLDIGGMHLTDDVDDPTKWEIPPGTVIPANGYLIFFASGKDIRRGELDERGYLHTNFGLRVQGEYLALTGLDGSVLHEYAPAYPAQYPGASFGLVDGLWRYFEPPSPGQANSGGFVGRVAETSFSVPRGFFDQPFSLQITAPTPGATLVYTTDGSVPNLTNGIQIAAADSASPPVAALSIDKTTTLRAAAFKPGYLPGEVETDTYIFVQDVAQQRRLSTTVRNHPEWGPKLPDSLLALPTVSLVLEGSISESRERATSVELIFPDGTPGFQIDAGVEHYGGHSLNSPKKNMRLSFKSEYGAGKLKYDLFGDGAVDEFDQLLLRTGSHDTFFWTHPAGGRGNYIRNRWAFDRQLEMGQPAPHGRFVQVYINGEYWGQHHLMERPDASFMASYFGGQPEDYDALNAGAAVDGDLTAWRTLLRRETVTDYQTLTQYLDLVNYADYMLLQFYGGNDWDWNTEQNWMAARKREEGAGFVFFSWDSDVILRTTANANVISRGGPGNLWNAGGGPKQHEEFRMLLADRAQRYFFNDGMFTDQRLRRDIDQLADQIRLSMIAETARWGGRTYTPDVWESAIQWMKNTYVPEGRSGRAATVINQLRRARLFPSIDAPAYLINGRAQHGGDVDLRAALTLAAEKGDIYYTLDGSDPRLPGGAVNPNAVRYQGEAIPLTLSVTVKSRALSEGEWSALSEAGFRVAVVPADALNLRISEVHYHPAPPTPEEIALGHRDADDFEFIELVNISDRTVDLASAKLVRTDVDGNREGVDFDFGRASLQLLNPGQHVLVVEDINAFQARYGTDLPVAGQWTGGLDNRREQITLMAGDQTIVQFSYDDRWYPLTDGQGYSLQIVDAGAADLSRWGQASGWRVSDEPGGSPGSGPAGVRPGDANRDAVFDSADLVLVFQAGEYEDTIAGNSTWEDGDWNGDGDFTSADLVLAFRDGGYVHAARADTFAALAGADGTAPHPEEDLLSTKFVARRVSAEPVAARRPADELELQARDAVFARWRRRDVPDGQSGWRPHDVPDDESGWRRRDVPDDESGWRRRDVPDVPSGGIAHRAAQETTLITLHRPCVGGSNE